MMEKPTTILASNETPKTEDYLLLTHNIRADMRFDYIIENTMYSMYFLKSGSAEHQDFRYSYMFSDNDFFIEGFSVLDGPSRWSINGESTVYVFLDMQDYIINLHCYHGIPEQILSNRKMNFSFYLNDKLLAVLDGTDIEKNHPIISFTAPRQYIHDGWNDFVIKSDTWSPSELGASDSWQLGLSISGIVMMKDESQVVLDYCERRNDNGTE